MNKLEGSDINWLIIGACTGTFMAMVEICNRYPELTLMPCNKRWTLQPRIEWVREIVEAADKAGVKVFLKDNLYQLYLSNPQDSCYWMFKDAKLRQEMPEIR